MDTAELIRADEVERLGELWATNEINALRQEIADLKAEKIGLIQERNEAHESLSAWFDTSKQSEVMLTPILMDALRGYLRTSRSGGMSKDLSDSVEAVLEDFCRLYVGRTVLPVIRGIAEGMEHG